jgi:hypothetical protein
MGSVAGVESQMPENKKTYQGIEWFRVETDCTHGMHRQWLTVNGDGWVVRYLSGSKRWVLEPTGETPKKAIYPLYLDGVNYLITAFTALSRALSHLNEEYWTEHRKELGNVVRDN